MFFDEWLEIILNEDLKFELWGNLEKVLSSLLSSISGYFCFRTYSFDWLLRYYCVISARVLISTFITFFRIFFHIAMICISLSSLCFLRENSFFIPFSEKLSMLLILIGCATIKTVKLVNMCSSANIWPRLLASSIDRYCTLYSSTIKWRFLVPRCLSFGNI